MKEILNQIIGSSIYSVYSLGICNYGYTDQKISFEKTFFMHLINKKTGKESFFHIEIEPVLSDFDYNLSKLSIKTHSESLPLYGSNMENITRCVLASKKIEEISVYGFPINHIIESAFEKHQKNTENFILFKFENNDLLFFDSSYDLFNLTLIFDKNEIDERIKNYGLIKAYTI